MENYTPNHHSAETLITSAVNRVKETAEEQIHRAGLYTQRSPFAALAFAAAAGYLLRSLPVRALLGIFLRLGLVLLRPFIFIYGAMNLYHFFRSAAEAGPDTRPAEEYTPGEPGH